MNINVVSNIAKMLFSDDKNTHLAKTILIKNQNILIDFINVYFSNDTCCEEVIENINNITDLDILFGRFTTLKITFIDNDVIYLWSIANELNISLNKFKEVL